MTRGLGPFWQSAYMSIENEERQVPKIRRHSLKQIATFKKAIDYNKPESAPYKTEIEVSMQKEKTILHIVVLEFMA